MTPSLRRDPLQQFIGLLLGGLFAALAGTALFSHLQYVELDEAVELARRSGETIGAVDAAGRELERADAALLDHLLTGHQSALATCLATVTSAERRLAELEQFVDAGADQRASLRHLQTLGSQEIAALGRVVALNDARLGPAALELVRGSEARRRMDGIRSVIATMTAREQLLLGQHQSEARAKQALTRQLSWLTEAAMALVFAGGFFFVRRERRDRRATTEALLTSQRELDTSERRITSMANALPALIGYVDSNETYRFANCRYETFFAAPAGSIVGKTVRDLLGGRTYAATKGRITGVLAGTPQSFERFDAMGDRGAHLLINYVPDRDADGRVVGFYVMVLDITDRKTAEMAQQINERRFRAITDNIPALIAHLDRDHRYLHTNEGFRRLWGADPNDLIGKTLREFRGEAVYAQISEHLLGVLQGETRRFEVREMIDGIEHHLQQSLVPDLGTDGTVQGYYSVSFDITDLRRNERLLIESSARHRSIVEEQSELVSLATTEGELIYVNPAYARHFDLAPPALVGTSFYDLIDPDDRTKVRTTVDAVLRTGVPSSSENRIVGADGRERWVAWTNTLQRDSHGGTTLRSVGRDVTEQRRAERALRESEEFLSATGRLAGVGGWHLDLGTHAVYWSEEVRRIHEVPADYQPTHATAIDFYAPEARPLISAAVRRGIDTGESWDLELRLITVTGRHIWVRTVGRVQFEDGRPARLVGAFQDIDARKLAELAVEQKERLLRTVTDNLSVLVMYVDRQETVRFINATGAKWLGLQRDAAIERPLVSVLKPRRYAGMKDDLRRALDGTHGESELLGEFEGRTRHLRLAYRPDRQPDGSVAGIFVMVTDITPSKETERQLEQLARIDPLTGLPNRRQFDEKLEEALRRRQRGGQEVAVMFLDIDHFKSINDTLGHAGGDAVLKEFGARLRQSVRETDVVARLAGDEFVVLLEGLAAAEDASIVAEKIVGAMRVEFGVGAVALRVTTSLGIGITSGAGAAPPSASELMMCADKALYEAKREGRDGFRLSNFGELALAA